MTHTYAVLEVPATVYAAIRALLSVANYDHAFHENTDGEVIDMHGIALKAKGDAGTSFTVGSLVSNRTGLGRVEMQVNGEVTQMDLDKAREIVGMLQGAIEAAVSDQLMTQFLKERIGLSPEKASMALLEFREMRQGSKDRVHPS